MMFLCLRVKKEKIEGSDMDKAKKKKTKVKYFSLFVEYKGKKLRVLIGVKILHEPFFTDGDVCAVMFAYQSPSEEKDDLISAKKVIKENLSNADYFLVPKKRITIENLVTLAMAYPILCAEVSWIKKSHILYIERTF